MFWVESLFVLLPLCFSFWYLLHIFCTYLWYIIYMFVQDLHTSATVTPEMLHIKYGTYQFLLLCTAFLCCHLVPEEEEEEEVKLENIHGQTIITKRWHSTQQLVHTQESINAPKTFNKCHVFNESWMEKSSAHVGSHRGDRKWIQCLIHFCFVTTDDLNSIVLQSLKL